jgi:hypothetical protein
VEHTLRRRAPVFVATALVAPRRVLSSGILASVAVGCALVATWAAPSHAVAAGDLITAHKLRSVSCVLKGGNTVSARVNLTMSVVNYHGKRGLDWADHMEAKARLEPTTAGLNYSRSWRSWKTPYLTQDKRHVYNIDLVTDNLRPDVSWRVHVKLIWHRPWPATNITRDLYRPFDTSCAGFSLPASGQSQLPSVGGG